MRNYIILFITIIVLISIIINIGILIYINGLNNSLFQLAFLIIPVYLISVSISKLLFRKKMNNDNLILVSVFVMLVNFVILEEPLFFKLVLIIQSLILMFCFFL